MARISKWVDVGNGVKKGVDSRGRTWVIEPHDPNNAFPKADIDAIRESARAKIAAHAAEVAERAARRARIPDYANMREGQKGRAA